MSQLFNDRKVTRLVHKYNNGQDLIQDRIVLGEILSESSTLIAVITSKYAGGDTDYQEDLMQDARFKLIRAIPKYDPGRDSKVYSFFCAVIRNAALDNVRKEFPNNFPDEPEEGEDIGDKEFVYILVDEMREWFLARFPTTVPRHLATELLKNVVADVLNTECGKKCGANHIMDDYGFPRKLAKVVHEVVIIRLRKRHKRPRRFTKKPAEDSLYPEVVEAVGPDGFYELHYSLYGFSLSFRD
jgi:RNA polymerase sigma factor (sigma-70 family)